jgi:hypothetical protein
MGSSSEGGVVLQSAGVNDLREPVLQDSVAGETFGSTTQGAVLVPSSGLEKFDKPSRIEKRKASNVLAPYVTKIACTMSKNKKAT